MHIRCQQQKKKALGRIQEPGGRRSHNKCGWLAVLPAGGLGNSPPFPFERQKGQPGTAITGSNSSPIPASRAQLWLALGPAGPWNKPLKRLWGHDLKSLESGRQRAHDRKPRTRLYRGPLDVRVCPSCEGTGNTIRHPLRLPCSFQRVKPFTTPTDSGLRSVLGIPAFLSRDSFAHDVPLDRRFF